MSVTAVTAGRASYLASAPLQPGDRVRFVSPSGPGNAESLERAVGYYRDWGLDVVVGDHVLDPHPRASYLAGSDDVRRQDLVDAWCDPDTDAVVCLRGGYGAMRLLDGIDWSRMRASALRRDGRPKLLTGSSDVTALHEAFRVHLDVPTLFCPMPGNDVFRDATSVRGDVHRWLFEPWAGRSIVGPRTEVLVPGAAEGRFTGGNLSLLAMALGAAEAEARPGGILFLEDIDEEAYRLDSYLLQLQRAGRLADAAGIVLGSWHKCAEPGAVRALMQEYLGDLGVPVLWEQGFGHDPEALSVPLNVDGVLDAVQAGGGIRLAVAEAV
ncbi:MULTISPECIES: LD-carboxypeptidase [unclassified Microbacterium]|uniref:S66 peptidase family protein n=1 Tax=unclassified Microbacterium TaxID=2609290 RepID=UPI00214AF969|nr:MULTISPECIES: LD-carboxypeptidase [unclassified Microbacterium]MCR2784732.1 LD-carboxypeptidase [Microbacterium sp. zg.B96]WIM16271.1 LD-carboxypeptidase [Microbacterium sp. zg-B96]